MKEKKNGKIASKVLKNIEVADARKSLSRMARGGLMIGLIGAGVCLVLWLILG